MEPYRSEQPDVGKRLFQTERVSESVLLLPTGTAIAPTDALAIGEIIRIANESGQLVRRNMGNLARRIEPHAPGPQ